MDKIFHRGRQELVDLLDEYRTMLVRKYPGTVMMSQFRLKACCETKNIWEYQHSTSQVFRKDMETADFLDAIDMCGASRLMVSTAEEDKKVDAPYWKDWFLKKSSGKLLVPDTNFIRRHYGSRVLSRLLGTDFEKLKFRIPRLVVLEIERQGNQDETKKQRKKTKTEKKENSGRDKRLAFYAASEINFLKRRLAERPYSFEMLAHLDTSLIANFSQIAGTRFVDALIRQEIHDFTYSQALASAQEGILFLTCDLMNALAAEAEGIHTCYFNRLPQESFFIDAENSEQLADLIIATAMLFEETKLDVILEGDIVNSSSLIKGMWEGKTTSEWYSDTIEEIGLV